MTILHGAEIKIGARTFFMPPMNIGAFVKTRADRELLAKEGIAQEDQALAICRVIHAALVRNYPGLTLEEITDVVTLGNMGSVWREACLAWASKDDHSGKEVAETPT